jgi:hypothetical protein
MPQHRDDSKAEFPEGRTGMNDGGTASKVSRVPDDQKGVWGRPEGRGLSPVPDDEDLPAEERTFSQQGSAGSQPSSAPYVATDERQNQGHLGREDFTPTKNSSQHDRDRLAKESGAE